MSTTPRTQEGPADPPPRIVERSVAAAYRARSLESRAGSVLSLGIVCVLGVGLLAWYYAAALKRPARASERARAAIESRAQSEMALPPLPALAALETGRVGSRPEPLPRAIQRAVPPRAAMAGQAPTPPAPLPSSGILHAVSVQPFVAAQPLSPTHPYAPATPAAPRARGHALERRLSGPAFAAQSGTSGGGTEPAAGGVPTQLVPSAAATGGSDLARLLVPTMTPAVAAQVLPTRTLLLPKGTFIDCTLETAIDSTLPGMTTCITATDTFGADGKVVLLERGSKLVGETRGEVQQGSARIFVLWTEARTPTGVVIPLASPGTDELGRSGLPGSVSRHFFERFGAALLISIIDAGAQAAAQSGSGTVIYSPATTQDVVSEVLKDTLRIPPTVVKPQGDRIQVLVARDLDFRSVYELRIAKRRR